MKKWLGIVMMSFYLVMSIGVQLHMHYCCGQLSDIHLFVHESCNHANDDSDHCCKKNECCSFIHLDLKVDDTHQPADSFSFEPIDFSENVKPSLEGFARVESASLHSFVEDSSPPIARRFLLYQSLMLYA